MASFSPGQFDTKTLHTHPHGAAVRRILAAAFESVHAGEAVKNFLRESPVSDAKRTFALGLGKAACAMTQALADSVPLKDTLIITKHASPLDLKPVTVIEGNHPIPGDASIAAGRAALQFVSQLTKDDLLLCLISGGGSALMTAPILPLADLQSLTSALLACGARIDEINTIRRHLDLLKGGGLAQAANGATIMSLILSDVVGDSIEAIASGPTAPDPSTREDAIAIIKKYGLNEEVIVSFRETAKAGDPLFGNIHNQIIGSNDIALRAAQQQAETEGFEAVILASGLQGEAGEIGGQIAVQLSEACRKYQRPFCLLAGGEMTVTIKGNGRGGRNQETVLGAVDELQKMKDVLFLSIATDGEDGPTDAAGAVATNETAQRAESLGLSAAEFRSRNDAYEFFRPLGDLLQPGPSGTNVNDLIFCFAY